MAEDHREAPQYGKPIVSVVGDKVQLICDRVCGHTSVMTGDEAWDLGDDLMIASDRLITWEPVQIVMPPWMDAISVAIAKGPEGPVTTRLALVCQDHGVIEYNGASISVGQILEGARTHWRWQHSAQVDVSEHPEGEDGQTDTDPAVPEPEPDTEAVHDAHGGGDQVKDDLQDSHGH